MQDALTYEAQDLGIIRAKVSPEVWSMLLAASSDPEGYADQPVCYLDCEVEMDVDPDDTPSWAVTKIILQDGSVVSGNAAWLALHAALEKQSASIEDWVLGELGLSWHACGEWNGEWRAA